MGIRGTVLDIYVARNGETLVLLHEGEVEICSVKGVCRIHNTIGRIIHTTVVSYGVALTSSPSCGFHPLA